MQQGYSLQNMHSTYGQNPLRQRQKQLKFWPIQCPIDFNVRLENPLLLGRLNSVSSIWMASFQREKLQGSVNFVFPQPAGKKSHGSVFKVQTPRLFSANEFYHKTPEGQELDVRYCQVQNTLNLPKSPNDSHLA